MRWPALALSELCEINVGRTPSRANPAFWGPGEPWLSIADMKQGFVIRTTKEQITHAAASAGRRVEPGTVLLSFKLTIGKVAAAGIPLYTNEAIAALPVKRPDLLSARFLAHALRTQDLSGSSNRAAMGATLNKAKLAQIQIPLPPLGEQDRIADLLDRVDSLRELRESSIATTDDLAQAIFQSCFAEAPKSDDLLPLGDLADVASGLTKGRKLAGQSTRRVPYLAVANVHAGRLRLDAVKEIPATEAEIARYALRGGDVVLTEGGDPDKLGRGTVWRDEVPLMLHQNHIFRVRIKDLDKLLPEYLAAFVASGPARSYFLKAAKQTTGIASINMTQLKALPVRVPPMKAQEVYVERVEAVARRRAQALAQLAGIEELRMSVTAAAFWNQP